MIFFKKMYLIILKVFYLTNKFNKLMDNIIMDETIDNYNQYGFDNNLDISELFWGFLIKIDQLILC